MNRCNRVNGLVCALAALTLLGFSGKAAAQVYREQTFLPYAPVHWHMYGGYSPTLGSSSDYFDGGYTVGGGLTWQPRAHQPFALRADIEFDYFPATGRLLNSAAQSFQHTINGGDASVVGLNLDGQYTVHLTGWMRGFGLAGIGVARMDVSRVQRGVHFSTVPCDPFFEFCGRGGVVDRTGATAVSWNVGLGVDIVLRSGKTVFVEARYERLDTAQPFTFVPLTVGVRF